MAIFWAFIVPYLKSLGMNNTYIGIIASLMILSGVVGQFVTGYICDVKGTIKKIFIISMIILSISIIFFFQSQNSTYMMVFIVIIGFFQSSAMGLTDSWVLESDSEIKENFGGIRALGSAGWGISAILVGSLIDRMGWDIIYVLYGIMTILLLGALYNMKDAKGDKVNLTEGVTFKDIKELLINKSYVHLLVILFLLFSGLHAAGTFSPIIIQNYGGAKFHVGLYLFVAATSEIPMLFYAKRLKVKYKLTALLVFAALAMAIRMVLVAYSNSIAAVVSLGAMQFITFSIIVFISKYLIDEVSPPKTKTMAQMVGMAIYHGLSGIFSTSLSGWLSDNIGMKGMLLFQAGLSFVAIILSLRYHYNRWKILR
ncbi:MFS transporter [Alkaliphilus serpentinus]|uniref:MFS transporter n=2 Tax=Alkaliphilus serpentinus TaxID=1482731 RepID=A0A833HPN0_9FIRM|nr:MFS transporter [Alkaliphilus serpentinus]